MVIAGAWFFIGAVINAASQDLAMLYIGRIFLGFGVGFANQSVSLSFSCAPKEPFVSAECCKAFAGLGLSCPLLVTIRQSS